ncbi:MAG TPA: helix-turn-helix domain-containing protein [Candidatus Angelobacter sp.]|nr:helix-turn-helix domain-containing protein [Candidatus Angelobacter sp.]
MSLASTKCEKRYVTTEQAATYSGIPANTLRAWRSEGKGPIYFKPAGRVLYDLRELDAFIRSSVRTSSVRAKLGAERNVSV